MSLTTAPSATPGLPAATPELLAAMAPIYERMERAVPAVEWAVHAPYVAEILRLKEARNAVILAHNYQSPVIFHGIADYQGDSLGLAQFGARTEAEVIVMCGVHFMAETAAILSPEKTVLIPDLKAGCSLAESISGADIRLLKERHPGVPVVTYVNTSADVKAESDICCTSANAVEVVESLGVEKVIFLPDEYLGHWVASQTDVQLILWKGHCEVHERFTGEEIRNYRKQDPGIYVLAHPECPQDVLAEADFVGSTSAMIQGVEASGASRVVMITECSMSDNVSVNFPEVDFVRPCNLCPHMQRITLPKVLRSLQTLEHQVMVDAETSERARRAVERMLEVGRGPRG
jgi:quinolinate synthase